MGATNRPQDLDSAIMRRMPTRFHINQPVGVFECYYKVKYSLFYKSLPMILRRE